MNILSVIAASRRRGDGAILLNRWDFTSSLESWVVSAPGTTVAEWVGGEARLFIPSGSNQTVSIESPTVYVNTKTYRVLWTARGNGFLRQSPTNGSTVISGSLGYNLTSSLVTYQQDFTFNVTNRRLRLQFLNTNNVEALIDWVEMYELP